MTLKETKKAPTLQTMTGIPPSMNPVLMIRGTNSVTTRQELYAALMAAIVLTNVCLGELLVNLSYHTSPRFRTRASISSTNMIRHAKTGCFT